MDEFCATTGYHRKHAITLLNRSDRPPQQPRRCQTLASSPHIITILAAIWEAAGYPWLTRLPALLPLWLPWARRRFPHFARRGTPVPTANFSNPSISPISTPTGACTPTGAAGRTAARGPVATAGDRPALAPAPRGAPEPACA